MSSIFGNNIVGASFDHRDPTQLAILSGCLVVTSFTLTLLKTRLFSQQQVIVKQDDGTSIRYIYPIPASGWLPVLGHALRVVAPDATKWLHANFQSSGGYKRPFYVELLGNRIVQCTGPQFRKSIVRAPDSQLCAIQGNGALFNFELTLGLEMLHKPFQAKVVRTTFVDLRKNHLLPIIYKGLEQALAVDVFPTLTKEGDSEMVSPLQNRMLDMISIMLSKILVGDILGSDKELVKAMKELTGEVNHITFQCQAMPKFLVKTSKLDKLKQIIHDAIEPEVRKRRASADDDDDDSKHHLDFLQLLIEAKDDKTDNYYSEYDIANRMISIIFGAFDTTVSTLSNLVLNLASPENAKCKDRVLQEVQTVLSLVPRSKEGGQPLLSQDIVSKEMLYTKACFYETLRRSNGIVSAPLRMVLKELQVPLGKSSVDGMEEIAILPKGTIASYSATLSHDDTSTFANPNKFDPESNQLAAKSQVDVSKNSIAFGLGRHSCPGRFFALEEIQTAIVVLFQNFHFELADGKNYEPMIIQGQPTVSDLPVKVTLTKNGETMFHRVRQESSNHDSKIE